MPQSVTRFGGEFAGPGQVCLRPQSSRVPSPVRRPGESEGGDERADEKNSDGGGDVPGEVDEHLSNAHRFGGTVQDRSGR